MNKNALEQKWRIDNLLDEEGRFLPTFIEDVGSACAENVRSAALLRWAKRNVEDAREWLRSVLFEEVGNLCLAREVELGKVPHPTEKGELRQHTCRIDLEFTSTETEGRVLAEVKWRAQPSIDQLEEYNEALKGKPKSTIILLTPIGVVDNDYSCWKTVPSGWKRLPKNVVPVVWASLSDQVKRTADQGGPDCHEDRALANTIGRWADLYEAVDDHVMQKDIAGLIELMGWMSEIQAPDDYSVLFKQLVLAKLAEQGLAVLGKSDWIRSDPSKGANGTDVTVDLFHKAYSFYQFKDMDLGHGMLISVRLRIVLRSQDPVIEMQIGSMRHPYGHNSGLSPNELIRYREKLRSIIRNHNYTPVQKGDQFDWRHLCSAIISSWGDFKDHLHRMAECLIELKTV